MRVNLVIALTALALVACGGDSDVKKIKSAVKERLIDPESARFGAAVFNPENTQACIEVNAKNRMGGYAGQTIASLSKVGSDWQVDQMDAAASLCPTGGKIVKAAD